MPPKKLLSPSPLEGLEDFINSGWVTRHRAYQIQPDEYNRSSLINPMIRNMVRFGFLPFETALSLTDADYKKTSLSSYYIQHLIMERSYPAARALAIPLTEITRYRGDPPEDDDLSPEQEQRLRLYQDNKHMYPDHAEMILYLESKPTLSDIEKFELKLLLDPMSRNYTESIMMLLKNADRSARQDRELQYLLYPPARPYARQMAHLEFIPDRSAIETEKLEDCYLNIACKLLSPHPGVVKVTVISGFDGEMSHEMDHDYDPAAKRKTEINAAIQKQVIQPYIQRHLSMSPTQNPSHWPNHSAQQVLRAYKAIQAAPMAATPLRAFAERFCAKIRFQVLQFFADPSTPGYSQEALADLLRSLNLRLASRQCSLSDIGNLVELHTAANADVTRMYTRRPDKFTL